MGVRSKETVVRQKTLEVPKDIYTSPDGEQTTFTVKLADNRAVLARQNLFDEVRYVTKDESGETETIRKFPMGDLRLETVSLVLLSWNLRPASEAPAFPVTVPNILDYVDPAEFEWLYNQIIDMNPVWGGTNAGED